MAEYIKREAAIETFEQAFDNNWEVSGTLDRIRAIPAADVVEVWHGRWKLHEDGSGTCQECGCRQKYVWDMDGWQNYCGHCGADMRNGGGRTILQSL